MNITREDFNRYNELAKRLDGNIEWRLSTGEVMELSRSLAWMQQFGQSMLEEIESQSNPESPKLKATK